MVGVDFFQAGCLAAQHLLGLGHQRFGVIADTAVPHTRHTERVAGFVATLAASGASWDPSLLSTADSSIVGGYAAAAALVRRIEPPTALFCTNDLMAIGALEAALAHAIAVPDQLSIIGVDDITISTYTHPPLTTVAIPKGQIAAEATALLLRWLIGDIPPAEAHQFAPTLVERRSTRAVGPSLEARTPAAGAGYHSLLDLPPGSWSTAALQDR
jgi:LacI family transcriptional regulator